MFSEKDMNDVDIIEEYDQDIEEDIGLEILKNMIRHNRPIRHIVEDTGYSEEYIMQLKEIMELIKRAYAKNE